jgi:hypothetical protein
VVFEGAALRGPLEADHLIAAVGERQHDGQELFEIAVEAAEDNRAALVG